ncbi:NADPH:quinone reductase [Terrimonas sp.]|uniref:NAD(P)H-dependent oxidoreductase n=1 Tax=Terrimonas sp. TaxID=1914338 RepID=UPI000D511EBA|nr:NAD(P)H-dependent oxidoreductase [Terrimonas sp.]PVD52679.1 NADPH:quinone reductase [Terrimonas sp.]
MRVAIVFNHPYEKSYCNAILIAVINGLQKAGHEVDLMHLDRDEFDPVMRAKDLYAFACAKADGENIYENIDPLVLNYKERLEQAEHLIFIFPIWWELMPAMTKGFIDKVIFPGISYDYAKSGLKMISRLKKLKRTTIITTQNTPALLYRLVFGNAVKYALLRGTFWKIGFPKRKWINLCLVKFVSDKKREKWLTSIESRFAALS